MYEKAVIAKRDILLKALDSLQSAILVQEKYIDSKDEYIWLALRDSLIKRFEYSFDLFWKYLKVYQEEVLNLDRENLKSPRKVLNSALSACIISPDSFKCCMHMLDSRNSTSHIYKEDFAEVISKSVPNFYSEMLAIIDKLSVK